MREVSNRRLVARRGQGSKGVQTDVLDADRLERKKKKLMI
jgi:hypothetical protein